MEYDFDVIEALIEEECMPKNVKLDEFGRAKMEAIPQKSISRRRSRSRSRESDRRRTRRSRSRSRSDSRRHRARDSRRSSRTRESDRPDRREDDDRRQRLEEERGKHSDRTKREDCSVMIMGLHPSCADKDVYEFFSKEAGKVRDLYVIRDSRTGKSKGVAYVEFYLQESIMKALGCNGRMVNGHGPIRVQASGAEKNRAAVAHRQATASLEDKPIVLYILGLYGALSAITETELKSLITPFGELEYVDIGRCPYTGKGRGFARVMFRRASDAREAMSCLNGFELCGQTLQVGFLSGSIGESHQSSSRGGDEEYLRTNQDRSRLMESLLKR